jgi:uncharacterized alpha-E superfamily protein
MKLEDAIELVLSSAKAKAQYSIQYHDIIEATNVVEDFFVNNVFPDGVEDFYKEHGNNVNSLMREHEGFHMDKEERDLQ